MVSINTALQSYTVNDVMTHWVVSISPADSLSKARDVMMQNRVSQLVVADQSRRPSGLISKRDIARFLLEDGTSREIGEITVSEASSKSVFKIRPDLSVVEAARLFDADNLSYSVVTNGNQLLGIVTETDLSHYFSQKFPGRFRVGDFMQSDFLFAKSTYPVIHVANAVILRQPSLPVIDEELVGILTLSDVLSVRGKFLSTFEWKTKAVGERDVALIATRDVMTRDPITTLETTDLAQAAQIIIKKGVNSLPVMDEGSKVVGLIAKHDIVKALAKIDRNLIGEAKKN